MPGAADFPLPEPTPVEELLGGQRPLRPAVPALHEDAGVGQAVSLEHEQVLGFAPGEPAAHASERLRLDLDVAAGLDVDHPPRLPRLSRPLGHAQLAGLDEHFVLARPAGSPRVEGVVPAGNRTVDRFDPLVKLQHLPRHVPAHLALEIDAEVGETGRGGRGRHGADRRRASGWAEGRHQASAGTEGRGRAGSHDRQPARTMTDEFTARPVEDEVAQVQPLQRPRLLVT